MVKKHEHSYPKEMPQVQAVEYSRRIQAHKAGKGKGVLQLLHFLLGISLHPHGSRHRNPDDADTFKAESARLVSLFTILDRIHHSGENALAFLEDLEMQAFLAVMIQRRHGLKSKPLQINGNVLESRRQEYVRRFQQSGSGFDVMLLSPRAVGVGLTLTAANHVIHLSRWWSPAVEDQCTDREFRIGQERDVQVHLPMARHPDIGEENFDFVLDKLLRHERELSTRMLVPPEDERADILAMSSVLKD